MKIRKIVLFIFTVLFFIFSVVLTFEAENIKKHYLPHVSAKPLGKRIFTIDGGRVKCYAIPAELKNNPEVFIIEYKDVNETECSFVRKKLLRTGDEEENFLPVIGNDYNGEPVVISTGRKLQDGEEVVVD